jgi:hypothetical protein
MELLLELGTEANYCKALPLLGPPGCGKTHFVHQYAALFEEKHGSKLRTLYVEVTAGTSLRGLAADVLKAAGDPDPGYGTQTEKTARAVNLLKGNYDVIYLDEFHRLINSQNQIVDKKAADWITNFLNYKVCPMVMIGEARCERVFVGSLQFDGRTFATARMEAFDWGCEEDRKEYVGLIATLEVMVGMAQSSDLFLGDIPLRFHVYSKGRLRQTAGLIDTAAWVARRENSPNIRIEHLVKGVQLNRKGADARLPNPFQVAEIRPAEHAPFDLQQDEKQD